MRNHTPPVKLSADFRATAPLKTLDDMRRELRTSDRRLALIHAGMSLTALAGLAAAVGAALVGILTLC